MNLRTDLMEFIYAQTCHMVGLDPTTEPQNIIPLNSMKDAAGLEDNSSNYAFYVLETTDDGINRQMDVSYDGGKTNNGTAAKTVKYVRTLRIRWELYGPDSFEWADKIRLALFTDDDRHTDFAAQGMSVLTDIPEPVFVPDPLNLLFCRDSMLKVFQAVR